MRKFFSISLIAAAIASSASVLAGPRGLVASLNNLAEGCYPSSFYANNNGKILLSWCLFAEDQSQSSFDVYLQLDGTEVKLNSSPLIGTTNFIDPLYDSCAYWDNPERHYILKDASTGETIDEYTLSSKQLSQGVPYFSIPLKSTVDVSKEYSYNLNDGSVGDLDGDGEPEIVVRREIADVEAWITKKVEHSQIWDAYKMDGTFLWRVLSGPNISTGNSSSFAVYDFDGDGCCEVALRTCEGFTFSDDICIADSNADDITDYRDGCTVHIPNCPDFLTVLEGATGCELASGPFIPMGDSERWGDSYYKRAASLRVATARVQPEGTAIIIARGIYARQEIEAWAFDGKALEKLWNWHCSESIEDPYYGQGYHSLSVADVDGDGYDEIINGSCTIDHDGTPMYSSAFGHGDALHVGKFIPDREGLQIWACCENDAGRGGYQYDNVAAALRDALTGQVLWRRDVDPENPDCGRALVADIDPDSPGCEMWYYKSNVHSADGQDLGYPYAGCNMAVWFDGSVNRQQMDGTEVYALSRNDKGEVVYQRPLRMGKYGATNSVADGLKKWPIIYGDFLGDWREEIVMPSEDQQSMMVFITWYLTGYSFPYLRSDHVYDMSMTNQNVGYNMPNQLGWYLSSDSNAAVKQIYGDDRFLPHQAQETIFTLQGFPIQSISAPGYYIINGCLRLVR